ncbi:hypothetical protein WI61_05110 [Burkholderia cepacia]|nr:hypothetical protein WI48_26545 [Burkholderia cepacia]KVA70679.1 hypothetical protein WI49_35865 [Burkholderia cepacia]KVA79574.1 hypothetical protein WI51_27155 [Burkholderia cepacia]KVA80715.1 hypothetical protein WI50_26250 [Burkholderia cepacia]KVA87916.1 hypothetical protein WI52_01205 [Burkholderia cepacia]
MVFDLTAIPRRDDLTNKWNGALTERGSSIETPFSKSGEHVAELFLLRLQIIFVCKGTTKKRCDCTGFFLKLSDLFVGAIFPSVFPFDKRKQWADRILRGID